MPSRPDYDLIVIGAGPAGTTAATLVKKQNPGAKVLIVEKAAFPRHHIGESLLPAANDILKEMEVFEKVQAAGFLRKVGVTFVWGRDRKPWDADFSNVKMELAQRHGKATDLEFSWQVLRSRYDAVLLEHARSKGVEVLTRRAVAPIEKSGRVCGVVLEGGDGTARRLTCRILADCSGQQGFMSKFRKTRRYHPELKNAACYAYFKDARWKFQYAGQPDKSRIFVCSVPEGWFWYIPLAKDVVSVGLVSKTEYVKRSKVKDMRSFFFDAVKACPEIAPLLEKARVLPGMDPAEPGKDFFTAADWSFASDSACGDGWLAAGDAAFFIDPLLSSGVLMAHLSGHRAAYSITTAWRHPDPGLRRLVWSEYERFCREIGGAFWNLVHFWYRHDPCAQAWWKEGVKSFRRRVPLDLSDKGAFTAVIAGISNRFERAYTDPAQGLTYRISTDAEDKVRSWRYDHGDNDVRVPRLFLFGENRKEWKAGNGKKSRGSGALDDALVPAWRIMPKIERSLLPVAGAGALRPIRAARFPAKPGLPEHAQVRRLLPRSYMRAVELIDGRRTVGEIKAALEATLALPKDLIAAQVGLLLSDLSEQELVSMRRGSRAKPRIRKPAPLRAAEEQLLSGRFEEAELGLTALLASGGGGPWALAMRGLARGRLGRHAQAEEDFRAALGPGPRAAKARASTDALLEEFDDSIERGWLQDRILAWRMSVRLAKADWAGAAADAEAALAVNPFNVEALTARARAARARGDLAGAKRDLETVRSMLEGRHGR